MIVAATAVASLVCFVMAFALLRVTGAATGVLAKTQAAVATMRDAALNDDAREKAMQDVSRRLLGDFFSILLRGGLAIAVSALPIWLADWWGLASAGDVLAFLSRPAVMLVATAIMVLGLLLRTRLWPSN